MTNDDPLPRLATEGERLGWIFSDRNLYRRRFTEPPPQPAPVPPELRERLERAERGRTRRILVSLGAGVLLAVLIGCCGGVLAADDDGGARALVFFVAGLSFVAGIAGAVIAALMPGWARKAVATAQQKAKDDYTRDHAAWASRREWHDQQQQQEVDARTEWSAASPSPGTRRVDIIGGTMYGWEAVLTVFGGSLLATRGRMVLADFTGEALSGELIRLAETTGRSVRELLLPEELAEFDLVAGLSPAELVDGLVEAMYGDAPEGNRAERSQDALLLTEVSTILAPRLTMARLLAGLRVLAGRPASAQLTPSEREQLLTLQTDPARVRRIEAFLHPLEEMGTSPSDAPITDLTCLVAGGSGGQAQNELLKDLTVQWLGRQVRREEPAIGSLVLLGADEIHHRALERLSTLCERRGIRLVLFFAHLRADSLRTIGGGEVALMRLGNHQEAQQAAEFVGRGHKFVLSRLTRSLGGEQTHTLADTYGETETKGGERGSRSFGRHLRRFSSTNWSKSRNWSQTESTAQGTNWSDASSAERVYEYTVEPRVLQDLPEYAMVLVKNEGAGSVVQAVEVDPAIVTLPRVSMKPLAAEPLPDPSEAVIPAPRALEASPEAAWGAISDPPRDRSNRER
ncbi:hypothetical protein AB0J83_04225 [Actinoplanes sp. NPDC049596]|uniref:hypothetical protein n=1 Tax=unclassified Actinoplanes TaxID=2626549 RepID=UPI003448915D